jgi:hypothetical protein
MRQPLWLVPLWVISKEGAPNFGRYFVPGTLSTLNDASNVWCWPPEEQNAPTPEGVAINWARYVLEDIMEGVFEATGGETISVEEILLSVVKDDATPERLQALGLALKLASVAPGKPFLAEEFARFLARRGKTHEVAPRWIKCSRAELLRALGKDKSHSKYINSLVDSKTMQLRVLEKPIGHSSVEVRFKDRNEHVSVWERIQAHRGLPPG